MLRELRFAMRLKTQTGKLRNKEIADVKNEMEYLFHNQQQSPKKTTMRLTQNQITDMAQDLEAGMKIFINRKDLEIRTILDWDEMYGDTEIWDDEMDKIEHEWTDYVVIEKLESRDAFKIMARFIGEIDDRPLAEALSNVLERKSPFANFKAIVERSDYREKWFEFKNQSYANYVRDMLSLNDIEVE